MATQYSSFAPTSGFPGQKKKQQQQNGADQGAGYQPVPGPGLPPPPVPGVPDVPKMALTASNRFGTLEQSGLPGIAGSALARYTQPNLPTPLPPTGQSAGALDLLPQRYDLTGARPDKGLPPEGIGEAGTQAMLGEYGAAVKAPGAVQMESAGGAGVPSDMDVWAGGTPPWIFDETGGGGEYGAYLKAPGAVQMESVKAPETPPVTEGAGFSPTPPGGFGTLYGEGWHDGTPEGQAALAQYSAWKAARDAAGAGTEGEKRPPPDEKKPPAEEKPPAAGPTRPSLDPADYQPVGSAADQEVSGWNKQFRDWLTYNMGNESPYSTELIQQGQQVLRDQIARQTAAGERSLREHFASRGLTGSSLEAEAMKDFQAQMLEMERRGNFDLGQAQVDAYLQQTSTVGGLAGQFGANLTDQQRNAMQGILEQMSLKLQEYGIDKESADRAAARQLDKEISDLDRESRETMQKKELVATYGGGEYTQQEWDAYDQAYGTAEDDLGPRPKGKTPGDETQGDGDEGGGDFYPPPDPNETNQNISDLEYKGPEYMATSFARAWQSAPPEARERLRQYAARATESGAWQTTEEIAADPRGFLAAASGGSDGEITTSFGMQFNQAVAAFIKAYGGAP